MPLTAPSSIRLPDPERDGAGVAAVYAPYVLGTPISFEQVPPTGEQMAQRIAAINRRHVFLVAEADDGAVLGYAYAGPHRERPAYRWCVDFAVYLAEQARGRGLGARLYRRLIELTTAQGYTAAFGGVTLPNEASTRLHLSAGFELLVTYPRVGYKLGRWHDVAWYRRTLADPSDPPAEPRAIDEVVRGGRGFDA